MAVRFGPKLLVASFILFAGYLAGRWVGNMVGNLLLRFKLEPPVRALLDRRKVAYCRVAPLAVARKAQERKYAVVAVVGIYPLKPYAVKVVLGKLGVGQIQFRDIAHRLAHSLVLYVL